MMNGQGSISNNSLGNFFVDERLRINNCGVAHNTLGPANSVFCEHQSSSIVNSQNQDGVNMVLANGSVAYGPSTLGRAHSDAFNIINLNTCTAHGGNHNGVNQGMAADNVGEEGSSDRRDLTYKRRAPEDASLGASSSSFRRAGNSDLQAAHVQEDANINLNISPHLFNSPNSNHPGHLERRMEIGMRRTHSDIYRTSNEVRQAESFSRNIRMRRACTNAQDFVPPSILSSGTRRNSDLQSPNQSTVLFDPFHNSATTGPVHALPRVQSLSYAPVSLPTLQPSTQCEAMRSRNAFSSLSHSHMINGIDLQRQNMRSLPRNIRTVPETEQRNLVCSLTDYNFDIENGVLLGNIASTAGNGSTLDAYVSAVPAWTQPLINADYEERLSNLVNHSLNESSRFVFRGQHSFRTLSSAASATVQEMEYSVRGSNSRISRGDRRTGMITRPVRQGNGPETHPSLRSWTVSQRQGRLLSEVQSAFAVLHRAGALWHEDLIIDDSVLYGLPDEDDMHEDMRLDVDNMSYEELLALEENMGNVSTGLSEEAILANLKRRKYQSVNIGTSGESEPCCICQDNYVNWEDIGKLDCGHEFHVNCIKQWLMQKNSCPICKMTGLAVRHN